MFARCTTTPWCSLALLLCLGATHTLQSAPVAPAKADKVLEIALKSGDLKKGESTLKARIEKNSKDDQARFALGILQFVRAIERMGQSWYEHGIKPEQTNAPFLRIPVQKNPKPKAISYKIFRRILDQTHHDLGIAERTLAGVQDKDVKLPVRLGLIHFDLDGDGKSTDQFSTLLKHIMGRSPALLKNNPEFLVKFDRGDAPWLRAYCHVLMSMLDAYLAFDTEEYFNQFADDVFIKAEKRKLPMRPNGTFLVVQEPKRLKQFRLHLIQVAELNRETWTHVRAETDDDFEWLPNPKQTGVLGLPVRDEMIDSWLGIVAEVEGLLRGQKGFGLVGQKNGKIFSVQKFLDDPPEVIGPMEPGEKYYEKLPEINVQKLIQFFGVFQGPEGVAYVLWFN